MAVKLGKRNARVRKQLRIRRKIKGTADRPRLSVYRSLSNIYVQVIDDDAGCTLASASTLDVAVKDDIDYGGNKKAARKVGQLIGKRALDKGIKKVVFDRGGRLYHGRIKELADGAREAGLDF